MLMVRVGRFGANYHVQSGLWMYLFLLFYKRLSTALPGGRDLA